MDTLFYQKYLRMGIADNFEWINLDSVTKIAEMGRKSEL